MMMVMIMILKKTLMTAIMMLIMVIITKIIKLLANLATEEEFAHLSLLGDGTQELIGQLVQAVDKRTIDSNEEFILNAISCTTNLLFYDLPQRPILNDEIRISIFNSIKLYILAT